MIIEPSKLTFNHPKGFIALEGVNGAGKSTLQESIANFIMAANCSVTCTREPGATELGKHLRCILLEHSHGQVGHLTEAFLFAADRAQHVSQVIKPALSKKTAVITDRFLYSTTAFQGYGRGLSIATLDEINKIAVDGTLPDLVFLLDLDPAEGLKRTKGRDQGKDDFEQEELSFHKRLRDGFLEIAKTSKEPFVILDASKSADQVFAQAKPALELWLKAWKKNL